MSSVQLPFHQRLQGLRVLHEGLAAEAVGTDPVSATRIDILLEQQQREARASEACIQLVSDLQGVIGQVRETLDRRFQEMSDYVLQLAFGLASRVLDREIDEGRYDLRPTLTELLAQGLHGLGEGAIRIFLHPIDHERLLRGLGGHPSASLGREVELEVDPTVTLGSFRLETRLGQVLHSPELILERMTQKIREELS